MGKRKRKPSLPQWLADIIEKMNWPSFLERGLWVLELRLKSAVLPVARTVAAVTNRSRWVDLPHG